MRGAWAALLLALTPLPALAQTTLWAEGPARVVMSGDGRVLAERDGVPRAVEARLGDAARGAELVGVLDIARGRLVLLTAETAAGRRLAGFVLDRRGWSAAGAIPVGAGAVSLSPLAAPDPAFPEPAPLVPLRLLGGRLAADEQALPATLPLALGPGRCPGGPAGSAIEEAARLARALPPVEREAAALRLAACLVIAARPFEARRAIALVLGREGAARVGALEAELAFRLACSPHIVAIRRASPPEKTFLVATCVR